VAVTRTAEAAVEMMANPEMIEKIAIALEAKAETTVEREVEVKSEMGAMVAEGGAEVKDAMAVENEVGAREERVVRSVAEARNAMLLGRKIRKTKKIRKSAAAVVAVAVVAAVQSLAQTGRRLRRVIRMVELSSRLMTTHLRLFSLATKEILRLRIRKRKGRRWSGE